MSKLDTQSSISSQLPEELNEKQVSFLSNNFKREQILAWYSDFKSYADKNERLSLLDFTRFYKQIILKKNENDDSNEYCEFIFKAFDTSNSGMIGKYKYNNNNNKKKICQLINEEDVILNSNLF